MDKNLNRLDSPTKRGLAVVVLVLTLLAMMWLAIKITEKFPTVLTALVSTANSVYNYNPRHVGELIVSGPTTMIESGDVFNITWERLEVPGTYSFAYECVPGVTLDVRSADRSFTTITCDTPYSLGEVSAVEIAATSASSRFAEISYTITFFRTNGSNPTALSSSSVTIINPKLTLAGEVVLPDSSNDIATSATATSTLVTSTPPSETRPVAIATTTPITPAPPAQPVATTTKPSQATTSRPAAPRPAVPAITHPYEVPVSNPNGNTDLSVSYLGVGAMTEAGRFVNTGNIKTLTVGAIQFSVQNLGTRTSEPWYFIAQLPNGDSYTSLEQIPLKPSERSTLTLGFPALSSETGTARFGVTIYSPRDSVALNDTFTWSTSIVR